MFEAILAALENPAVDLAIIDAAKSLVLYFKSLPQQDREQQIALVNALAGSAANQVANADADLENAIKRIDELAAQHDQARATLVAVKEQIAKRFAPLPAGRSER